MKQVVRYYHTPSQSIRADILEEPESARIIECCVYYYRTGSIHSVYKAYRLREGESVEVEYVQYGDWGE